MLGGQQARARGNPEPNQYCRGGDRRQYRRARRENGPVLVQMSVEVHPDEVHVIFTDDGAPCPTYPETVNMPDELAERGRGIPMMQSVLRKLTYHRSATQNHWRLISRYFGR